MNPVIPHCSITSICYNSYLPLLSRAHPRVVAAAQEERVAAAEAAALRLTDGTAAGGSASPAAEAAPNPLHGLPAPAPAGGSVASPASLRITAPAVGAAAEGAGSGATPLVVAASPVAVGSGATAPLTRERGTALEVEARVSDELSITGFTWGYVAGIIGEDR